MTTLNKQLKAAIKASIDYMKSTKQQATVGPDFKAIIDDILYSDTCCAAIIAAGTSILSAGPVQVMLSIANSDGRPHCNRKIIQENQEVFAGALALLYWGIKIGEQNAAETAKAAAGVEELEKMFELKVPEKEGGKQ